MPVYRYAGPDGKTYVAEADTPEEAQAGLENLWASGKANAALAEAKAPSQLAAPSVAAARPRASAPSSAIPSGNLTPGVAAALRLLEKQDAAANPTSNRRLDFINSVSDRMAAGMSLGMTEGVPRLVGSGIAGIQNMLPGGDKMPYTAGDYYKASQLYEAAKRDKFSAEKPTTAITSDIIGGMAMAGGALLANFVTGKKALALAAAGKKVPLLTKTAQAARQGVVSGGLFGTQAAVQARPGEEGSEALRGTQTGLMLGPAMKVGAEGALKGVQAVGDILGKLSNKGAIPFEKLGQVLHELKIAPETLQTAIADLRAAGITPTIYDVLEKVGAGPDVLKMIKTQGAYPGTRVAATEHADTVIDRAQTAVVDTIRRLTPDLSGLYRRPSASGVAPSSVGAKPPAQDLYGEVQGTLKAAEAEHKALFKEAGKHNPESTVFDDEVLEPLRTSIFQVIKPLINPDIDGTLIVGKMFDKLTRGIVPEGEFRLPDLSKAEQQAVANAPAQTRAKFEESIRKATGKDKPVQVPAPMSAEAAPVTVEDLYKKRVALNAHIKQFVKTGQDEAVATAEAAKKVLDDFFADPNIANRIQGSKEAIDLTRKGLDAYAHSRQLEEAYKLGTKLLTTTSDDFVQVLTSVPAHLKPMVQAGATQHILNIFERPTEGSTGILDTLNNPQAKKNLNALFGKAGVDVNMTLQGVKRQLKNAFELSGTAGAPTPVNQTWIRPYEVMSPTLAVAGALMKKLKSGMRLSPQESEALMRYLQSNKYPTALPSAAKVKSRNVPVLGRPDTANADSEEMDRLRKNYGVR